MSPPKCGDRSPCARPFGSPFVEGRTTGGAGHQTSARVDLSGRPIGKETSDDPAVPHRASRRAGDDARDATCRGRALRRGGRLTTCQGDTDPQEPSLATAEPCGSPPWRWPRSSQGCCGSCCAEWLAGPHNGTGRRVLDGTASRRGPSLRRDRVCDRREWTGTPTPSQAPLMVPVSLRFQAGRGGLLLDRGRRAFDKRTGGRCSDQIKQATRPRRTGWAAG